MKKRIKKAKIKLLLEKPFFGYALLKLNIKKNNNIPTMAVDGEGNLFYNTEFVNSLDEKELQSVLCHEVLHILYLHLIRMDNKDQKIWNIATDLVVDEHCNRAGLKPYKGGMWYNMKEYQGHNNSAEQIYNSLYKSIKGKSSNNNEDKEGEGNGNTGWDTHIYKNLSKKEQEKLRKKWQQTFNEIAQSVRMQGKLPDFIEEILKNINYPKVNWREVLKNIITEIKDKTLYNWNRPNKRYINQGYYLPILDGNKVNMSIAIDTSGSISSKELSAFAGEINGILEGLDNYCVKFIQCDCEVKEVKEIEKPDIIDWTKVRIKGRGGTDFSPVFNELENDNINLLIYFTDGYGSFPEYEPDYPVLWVVVGDNKEFPFGTVIHLDDV